MFGLNLAHPDAKVRELYAKEFGTPVSTAHIPENVHRLLEERELARTERRWDKADSLRQEIEGHGYFIEDTPDGPRLMSKS